MLRSLVVVSESGAITTAADRMGLSQPALSRRIQQLEEIMGAPLLVRRRKGVELTAAGRLAVDEARELIRRFGQLQRKIRSQQHLEDGTISLGGGATAVAFLLPDAINQFQQKYPRIRFQLKEAGSREIAADVAAGRLELGLVTLPVAVRDLEQTEVMLDQIVLVGRNDHPLVGRQRVRGSDLMGHSYVGFEAGSAIRRIIDSVLRSAGVEINVVMELRSIPAILQMVAATGNLAFVSKVSIEGHSEISAISLQGITIERKIAVIARSGSEQSPAVRAFAARLIAQLTGEAAGDTPAKV